MRGGEVGGLQWDRVSIEHQAIYIDRVIDRVDKKLIEKLSKMDIIYTSPDLMMGTRTVIVLKQPIWGYLGSEERVAGPRPEKTERGGHLQPAL